ncbi:MAG: type II toxin-antitoxin system HicA family toxin [Candidatus Electryoneaceae bacterium]|nr:type II toxin-antitoxin system HicA family toxin [Candidatus Electryoneaceae bacterium]
MSSLLISLLVDFTNNNARENYGTNIVRVLNKFQFESKSGRGEHTKFSRKVIVETKMIRITTIIDGDNDIPTGTFHAILKQIHLSHKNHPDALKCPYGSDDYENDARE